MAASSDSQKSRDAQLRRSLTAMTDDDLTVQAALAFTRFLVETTDVPLGFRQRILDRRHKVFHRLLP